MITVSSRATLKRVEIQVNSGMRNFHVLLVIMTLFISCGFAQKVKTGYDKNADFSRYKSYTLQEPGATPTRPLLYASVMGSIKSEIESKGLVNKDKDGDLTVIPNGGLDYGMGTTSGFTSDSCSNCQKPLVDARDWVGKVAPPGASGKPNPKGVLQLDFVDRATNKVVWSGTVEQKLDPDKKQESLQKVGPAINKLLAEFPPKSK
jgi:hypothetical protein